MAEPDRPTLAPVRRLAPRTAARLLLALMGCAFACARPPSPRPEPRPAAEWFGRLLTDRAVVVAPGPGIYPDDSGRWRCGELGTIVIFLAEEARPNDRCRVEIAAAAPRAEALRRLALHFDGVRLEPALEGPDALRVDLPVSTLPPGLHRLDLSLAPSLDGSPVEVLLDSIRYGCSGDGALRPATALDHYLGSFLVSGVFPGEGALASGFAAESRGTVSLRVPPDAEAVRFVVTSAPLATTLRLTAGAEVAEAKVVGGTTGLRVRIPAGVEAVTATIEPQSEDRGLWFWNGPFWERRPVEAPRLVVLVTLDTFRRDLLATHGAPTPGTTPHLDRLARAATVFDQAWTTSPWTLPSHASMFTGRFPSEHGAGVSRGRLDSRFETLAELLRARGWVTLGLCGGPFCRSRLGIGQGFLRYVEPPDQQLAAAPIVDGALALLDELGPGGLGADAFLFLNLFDTHFPYRAPGYVPPIPPGRPIGQILAGDYRALVDLIERRTTVTEEEAALIREAYRAEARETDRQLGRLMEELDRRGLWREALVIVTADHGEFLGESGFWEHGSRLDRELLRVPLIVKVPGQTAGRRVASTASVVDVFATVLGFAGVELPERLTVSSLDLRDEAALGARPRIWSEEHEAPFHPLRVTKEGDHAILFLQGRRLALRTELGARCFEVSGEGAWLPLPCPEVPPLTDSEWRLEDAEGPFADPELRRQLRALGYLAD